MHFRARLNLNDTYGGTYRDTYLVLDLTFGKTFQKRNRSGTYYINATVTVEHREICFGEGSKTKQKTLSLNTKNYAEAYRVLYKVKQKI